MAGLGLGFIILLVGCLFCWSCLVLFGLVVCVVVVLVGLLLLVWFGLADKLLQV